MSDGRIALHELSDPRAGLLWFEAVAVTLGMAEAWPDGARTVPPFDAFTLGADGGVRPLPGAAASASPAGQVGAALQALLVDPLTPTALRDVATMAAEAPTGALAAPHLRSLAYFERPDRARVLQFLAERVVPALPEVNAEEELRRLQQRARERAEQEKPPGAWARLRASLGRAWKRWQPAVVAAALLAVVGAAAWGLQKSPEVRALVAGPLERARGWLRPSAPADAAAETTQNEAAAASSGSGAAREAARRVASPEDRAEAEATRAAPAALEAAAARTEDIDEGPALPAEPAQVDVSPPPDSPTEATGGVMMEGLGLVYREGDPGVQPARIGRRYTPSNAAQDASPGRTGVFELVVDEKGHVERVRLLSSDNRYQERMMLSAVKAWRFEPALKDGAPVKFLTHVKVTW